MVRRTGSLQIFFCQQHSETALPGSAMYSCRYGSVVAAVVSAAKISALHQAILEPASRVMVYMYARSRRLRDSAVLQMLGTRPVSPSPTGPSNNTSFPISCFVDSTKHCNACQRSRVYVLQLLWHHAELNPFSTAVTAKTGKTQSQQG